MFTAVREDKQSKVVHPNVDGTGYLTVCTIPHYYEHDHGIAEIIAKTLNEQNKYKMILSV